MAGTLLGRPEPATALEPRIAFWYGRRQRFGHLGLAQRWVNVLGSVSPAGSIAELAYSLNGGELHPLSMGSDLRRLASPGDFNIELDQKDLRAGDNYVSVRAVAGDGTVAEQRTVVEYTVGRQWPLPYAVDFREVQRLEDVCQVVDGDWMLTPDGVRTAVPYYDRVLAFGDLGWKNYALDAEVTFHGFPGKRSGGPHFGVNHAGIGLRWRGHADDGKQPRVQWHPLGAATEFTLEKNLDECRWRILPGPPAKAVRAEEPYPIELGRPYWLRGEVKTLPDGRHRYRTRIWSPDRNRLDFWAVESVEEAANDFASGSALIVAHNSDITVGRVRIEPIRR